MASMEGPVIVRRADGCTWAGMGGSQAVSGSNMAPKDVAPEELWGNSRHVEVEVRNCLLHVAVVCPGCQLVLMDLEERCLA